jgi:hypothetical protein
MKASVRILSVLTLVAAVALVVAVSTPAFAGERPTTQLIKPVYGGTNLGRGGSEGPVEMPHPIEPSQGGFSVAPEGATTSSTTSGMSGKLETTALSGSALPAARSRGAIVSPSARAERSIAQVIRRLG